MQINAPDNNKVNRYFFLGIIIVLAAFLFYSLSAFFTAFLLAIIFYVLSRPQIDKLVYKKNWKKSMVAVLVIVVTFFIILLPLIALISLLYGKVSGVINNPQPIIDGVKNIDNYLTEKTGMELISDKNIEAVQGYATGFLSLVVNQSLNFFTTIIMMYFFLYFMITSTGRMEAAILYYLPFRRDKIKLFGNELVAQTFSNAVGIPLIAVAQGIFGYLSFFIAGVHESGFWGVITGFASVIPVVGTGIVWAPISVYLLITGATWQGIFVALWGILILGTVDNVIRFLLAKRMADVHPIVTVLGVIIGLRYFGIAGLIFGPILISFFILLLKIYYTEYQRPQSVKKTEKPRQLMPSYMQPFLGTKKKKGS